MRLTTEVQGGVEGKQSAGRSEKNHTTTPHERNGHPASARSPESEEYSALVARATNDAVRIWDVKTGALAWPQGLDTLLGFDDAGDADTIAFWQEQVHPADHAQTARSIRDALGGDDQRWSGEYRLLRADGSYAVILERALIVRDANGQARRFVGALMDISARKHLHDHVQRAQKMEAFGQLAGSVAHDFNNFLTSILGYSDLLLTDNRIKGGLAGHIAEIRHAAKRASDLTAQLTAFSRKHPLAPRVLEVNSFVTNLERSLLRLLGENIRVVSDLYDEKGGAHIQADPNDMTQVITNLAVNARDAMPEGGTVFLRTSVEHVPEQPTTAAMCEDLPAGEYVTISVRDTGCGMSDAVKERLFEPFFTTKGHGKGSGLGLATSFGIVRQSGGHLCVVSEPGCGTTMTVYLPRVPAPEQSYKKAIAKKLPTGTETILVLEDDVSVRHLSVRVLRSLGYDVLEAANGDDAQRFVSARKDRTVDLLLTDIMMPQMSGHDFAAWLEKTSPQTKVIFVSGYLDESLRFAQICDRAIYFLPKPFDPEQLAIKVREALDS